MILQEMKTTTTMPPAKGILFIEWQAICELLIAIVHNLGYIVISYYLRGLHTIISTGYNLYLMLFPISSGLSYSFRFVYKLLEHVCV